MYLLFLVYLFKSLGWIYNNSVMCLINYYMHFISEISHLKVTHNTCVHNYKLHLAEDDTAAYLGRLKIQSRNTVNIYKHYFIEFMLKCRIS